jgi:hypothetical protein
VHRLRQRELDWDSLDRLSSEAGYFHDSGARLGDGHGPHLDLGEWGRHNEKEGWELTQPELEEYSLLNT